jgi:hypothetical protein
MIIPTVSSNQSALMLSALHRGLTRPVLVSLGSGLMLSAPHRGLTRPILVSLGSGASILAWENEQASTGRID